MNLQEPHPPEQTGLDRDARQSAALADRHDTVLVLGGPGTGRTTVCLERVAGYLTRGGRLDRAVLLTHSRGAAQELRNELLARVGGAHLAPRVMTVHAMAARVIAEHSGRASTLLTAPEQEFRIRELLAGSDLSGWPEQLRASAGTARFASDLRVLAAAVRQEGRDPLDLAELGDRFGIESWSVLGPFLAEYLDVLDLEQTLDYAEAVHRARILLADPEVLAAVVSTMDLLVVDDFGESDPSQAGLLAALTSGGVPTLLAVDPDQTAFEFRGAVPDRLEELTGLFPDLSVHHLVTDHRGAPAIHHVVEEIRGRLPLVPASPLLRRQPTAAGRADRPGDGAGEVDCILAPSDGRAVRELAGRLRRAHLIDHVEWSQMAVVTRHGSELAALAAVLASEGVPVHRSKEEVTLSGVHAVQVLLTALSASASLADGLDPQADATVALLRGPMSGLDQAVWHRIEQWCRVQRIGQLDWPVLTERLLGAGVGADSGPVPAPGLARAVTPARDLVARIRRAADRLRTGAEVHEALWVLWGASAWAAQLRSRALAGDSTADRELDGLCSLFDLAERTATLNGAAGARHLVAAVRQETIPADRSRESDRDRLGVSLLTAHRAKGRQFQVVAVTGLQEGSWPAPNHTGSLVAADSWSPQGPVPAPGWPQTVRAERRLLLLACSRARDLLILVAVEDSENGVRPSAFLTEIAAASTGGGEAQLLAGAGSSSAELPARFTRMSDLVGRLRRAATSPASSAAVRDQAAEILAELASKGVGPAQPDHWWATGWDPAVTDRDQAGMVALGSSGSAGQAGVIRLAASHVGELLSCPRQWFLTRRGEVSGAASPRAAAGSLVHQVAARTMAQGWSLQEARDRLSRDWADLEFPIGWQSGVEEEGAQLAMGRLDRWLRGRPATLVGTEVGFDHTFQLPCGPVRFKGSIDRLERDQTGRLVVVDLKAGTSTSPQVARSHLLQVGVYQAVVAAGGVQMLPDRPPVAVGGAELVYLRRGAGRGGADPKVVRQPSLADVPWPLGEDRPLEDGIPDWIHARIEQAARIALSGQLRAVPNPGCPFCPVRTGCPALTPPEDLPAEELNRLPQESR